VLRQWLGAGEASRRSSSATSISRRWKTTSGRHKQLLNDRVSHTPIECDEADSTCSRRRPATGSTLIRTLHIPSRGEGLSPGGATARHEWEKSNRGRRLDHIWATPDLARRSNGIEILREARGWTQPSDHVPVIATLKL
jgi:exodeoxyribonuclease-3